MNQFHKLVLAALLAFSVVQVKPVMAEPEDPPVVVEDPEPTDPGTEEPTNPEPTDPEPTDPEPTDPEPTDPEQPGEDEPGGDEPGGDEDPGWQEPDDPGYDDEDDDNTNVTPVLSSDSRLYSLYVDNATLNPEFSSDVLSYNVEVEHDVEEVNITANPWSNKASVQGAGKKALNQGNNAFNIIVTAEDDSTRTYKINILRKDNPMVYVDYEGRKLGVLAEYPANEVPKGFKKASIVIDNKEATCLQNKNGTITIVYLQDEEKQEAGFYYYDTTAKKVLYKFASIVVDNTTYYLVEIPLTKQKIKSMTLETTMINRQDVQIFTFNNDKDMANYSVLYLLSSDGKEGYYLYDNDTDKVTKIPDNIATSADTVKEWMTSQEKKSPIFEYGIYVGIAIGAVLVLGLIVKLLSRKKKAKKYDDEDMVFEVQNNGSEAEKPSQADREAKLDEFVVSVFGNNNTSSKKDFTDDISFDFERVDFPSLSPVMEEPKPKPAPKNEEDDWLSLDILSSVLDEDDK